MKRIIFSVLLCLMVQMTYAQKDTWLLYGNAGLLSSQDTSNTSKSIWNVNLGVGYQFTDNWIGGIRGGYGRSLQSKSGTDKSSSLYNTGIFLRYVHVLKGRFCYYGQINLNYQGGRRDVNGNANMTWNGFSMNLIPAIRADVGHDVGLAFGIGGLDYISTRYSSGAKSSYLNLSFGKNVFIGMSKKLGVHHRVVEAS